MLQAFASKLIQASYSSGRHVCLIQQYDLAVPQILQTMLNAMIAWNVIRPMQNSAVTAPAMCFNANNTKTSKVQSIITETNKFLMCFNTSNTKTSKVQSIITGTNKFLYA
mmetsp:Transcript_17896/g.41064  ORF Transcript_17896/g.41064 Transcript_17896/m.41064 type:complete len:110 (+) Transcript_17896:78-407(+)